MITFKTIIENRIRFIMTTALIALCTILMLLLVSIYKGVADGSVEYIRASRADLWVMQKYASNILRSNSYLPLSHAEAIRKTEGVAEVEPVFFLLVQADCSKNKPTLYLAGYNPESGLGGPPAIVKGANINGPDQIVVDQSFARKYKIHLNDKIQIKKERLTVTGISSGTNMFVIQYAFVDVETAFRIAGIDDYVSCFQVISGKTEDIKKVTQKIEDKLGNTSVYARAEFLSNNLREMESGIMPLLFAVAVISAIVLTIVLSLILTIHVLEQREEYSILKTIGASQGFIPILIAKQSLILASCGLGLGFLLFFPLSWMVEFLSPEVSTSTSAWHLLLVGLTVEILSLASTILPGIKLRSIYPLELFR